MGVQKHRVDSALVSRLLCLTFQHLVFSKEQERFEFAKAQLLEVADLFRLAHQ